MSFLDSLIINVFFFFACLVIFHWMLVIMNFPLLMLEISCVSLNILQLCYEMKLCGNLVFSRLSFKSH